MQIDANTKSQSAVNPVSVTPQQKTKISDNAHQNIPEINSTSSFTKTSIDPKEAGCCVSKSNISHVSDSKQVDKSKMIQQPLKIIQQPLNLMLKDQAFQLLINLIKYHAMIFNNIMWIFIRQ